MYCRNCGEQMDPNASVCVKCGFAKNTGNSYCPNCGEAINPGASVCVRCGTSLVASSPSDKSRLVAGLLGIFLGTLGIHNFYLGYTKRAVTQLLISLIVGPITCGVADIVVWIWTLVESIKILSDKNSVDSEGRLLQD